MRSKPPHTVALLASWVLSFAVMTTVAVFDAGLSAWLQGTIYLLAAVLLGLGCAGILRYSYFGERAGYRQGIYYIVFAWVFAAHAYYRVREHREGVLKDEAQLAPVLSALIEFRSARGQLPQSLAELSDLPPHLPHLPHLSYQADPSGTFRLSFRHDVFVAHAYDSTAGAWRDEIQLPE